MNFEVTVEEANLILNSLVEMPFKVSAGIIQDMQAQAKAQLPPEQAPKETVINLEFVVLEANIIIDALTQMPFKLSAALIQKLQQQGKAQLDQPKEQPDA
jgi:hypothetical protein